MRNRQNLYSCLQNFAVLAILLVSLTPSASVSQTETQDHYKLLGISRLASDSEIKLAFRRMAAKYHPDKWTQASSAEIQRAQSIFIQVRKAYEALSDPKKRRAYDLQNGIDAKHSELSLALVIQEIKSASSASEMTEALYKLDELRAAVYEGSEAYRDSTASAALKEVFNIKIDQGIFDHLPTALALIEMTANWTYFEGENEFRQTLNWDSIHLNVIKRWLDKGLSLNQALAQLKSLSLQVDVKLAMSFNNQTGLKSPSLPFYLTGEIADGLLHHQLTTGKIRTAQDLSDAMEIIVKASGPNGYQRPLFSSGNLTGLTKHIIPLLPEMTSTQIHDWARLCRSNPIESLGFLQSLLQTKLAKNQMAAGTAFTADDILKTFKIIIEGSLDHHLKEVRTMTRGPLIDAYMRSHPRYDQDTLQKWVTKEIQDAKKRQALFAPDRGHERFLYPVLKKDFLNLIIENKSILNKWGFNSRHWDDLRASLNVSSLEFTAKSLIQPWPKKPSIDWIKATQQLKNFDSKTTAPSCTKIFLQ